MAEIDLVAGNRFRLYRQNDSTPSQYDYLALATTLSFNRSTTFEDATAPDATDPLVTPVRRSAARSFQWDMSFSGRIDAKLLEKVEDDVESGVSHSYRVTTDMSLAKGGKTYTGPVLIESLEIGTSERGFVTFTARARGDGSFTTTPASA